MQPPDIDKLTLELLTNKNQYKKYLAKTDPEKHRASQEYLEKIEKYRYKIQSMFTQLLDDPEKQITHEISEDFHSFVKTAIHHFEMKELERETDTYSYREDEDVLFGNCDERDEMIEHDGPSTTKSFWGKPIIKKGREQLPAGYTMDLFLKSSKR
jgi:hypothetical protein